MVKSCKHMQKNATANLQARYIILILYYRSGVIFREQYDFEFISQFKNKQRERTSFGCFMPWRFHFLKKVNYFSKITHFWPKNGAAIIQGSNKFINCQIWTTFRCGVIKKCNAQMFHSRPNQRFKRLFKQMLRSASPINFLNIIFHKMSNFVVLCASLVCWPSLFYPIFHLPFYDENLNCCFFCD